MQRIKIKDKEFKISIRAEEIANAVKQVASQINRDYEGKDPVFLSVLNGSYVFAADLLRHIKGPCRISFVKLSSYSGTTTTSHVKELIGLNEDIQGKDVIILEDIIDTGITVDRLLEEVKKRNPASIRIACFCYKPEAFQKNFHIDYIGMKIPNKFIVGYGLDYDGYGRNLPHIYEVVD
ncbi:MAG: hypoxanthine phosphoribosyltransferase [Bacteroidota bacterium]|nr:hypoxanthine phosphoribosyltransferase [Bacteroidota bacterium]